MQFGTASNACGGIGGPPLRRKDGPRGGTSGGAGSGGESSPGSINNYVSLDSLILKHTYV